VGPRLSHAAADVFCLTPVQRGIGAQCAILFWLRRQSVLVVKVALLLNYLALQHTVLNPRALLCLQLARFHTVTSFDRLSR
jgi:hypothetical protein